jgi:predicted transcriptional regulator
MLGELVDAYCGGSIEDLVMNIIRSEKLSEDDLIALRRLADREGEQPPPAGGGGRKR